VRAVGRILIAILGFVLAVIAAAAFLLAARVGFMPHDPGMAPLFWTQYALSGAMAASMIGSAAFIPMAIWILISEILGIRALVPHLAVGGLLGGAAAMGFGIMGRHGGEVDRVTLLLAAGFVGGLVYWLVAGRTAGLVGAETAEPPSGVRPPAP
jgi:hypothetical protein